MLYSHLNTLPFWKAITTFLRLNECSCIHGRNILYFVNKIKSHIMSRGTKIKSNRFSVVKNVSRKIMEQHLLSTERKYCQPRTLYSVKISLKVKREWLSWHRKAEGNNYHLTLSTKIYRTSFRGRWEILPNRNLDLQKEDQNGWPSTSVISDTVASELIALWNPADKTAVSIWPTQEEPWSTNSHVSKGYWKQALQ